MHLTLSRIKSILSRYKLLLLALVFLVLFILSYCLKQSLSRKGWERRKRDVLPWNESYFSSFSFPELWNKSVHLPPHEMRYYYYYVERQNANFLPIEYKLFHPVISRQERQMLLYVLQAFISACRKSRISFSIFSGTLIGSYRHHDIVPWDDDIDVLVNITDKRRLQTVLEAIDPDMFAVRTKGEERVVLESDNQFQFFLKDYTTETNWPFVEIFFYSENDTHIFLDKKAYRHRYWYDKSLIFPLSERPLAGAMLPVPCNTYAAINKTYDISDCKIHNYNHRDAKGIETLFRLKTPCENLHAYFPFVTARDPLGHDLVEEILTIGDTKLGSVVISTLCDGYRP